MTLLALAACGPGPGEITPAGPEAYAPIEGRYVEYTTPEDTAAPPLMLTAAEGTWTVREGPSWPQGAELAVLPVVAEGGVSVDGVVIVPSTLTVGTVEGGTEVIAVDPVTTWYGTFEEVVTVNVGEGRLAGEQSLAPGIGPVVLTLDGRRVELVYYE